MSAVALSKIYHDPKYPGSLGGVERLLWRAMQLHVQGATRQRVKKYQRSEQAYTLHKPSRHRFTRNHTYVAGIDAQWQADLADMQGIERQNVEIRYLFTVIDVFSKFAWTVPVQSKDAKQSRQPSVRCSRPHIYATLGAYRPIRARSLLTRTFRP